MARSHNEPAREARSGSSDQDCAELSLTMWRHVSLHESLPIQARLSYDHTQPLEVRVEFLNDIGGAVTWVLSRDLLIAGLHQPSGHGDVRIWPSADYADGPVYVELCSPSGQALFEAPRGKLVEFLYRTYELVPPGQESEHLNIDAELEVLLVHDDLA